MNKEKVINTIQTRPVPIKGNDYQQNQSDLSGTFIKKGQKDRVLANIGIINQILSIY